MSLSHRFFFRIRRSNFGTNTRRCNLHGNIPPRYPFSFHVFPAWNGPVWFRRWNRSHYHHRTRYSGYRASGRTASSSLACPSALSQCRSGCRSIGPVRWANPGGLSHHSIPFLEENHLENENVLSNKVEITWEITFDVAAGSFTRGWRERGIRIAKLCQSTCQFWAAELLLLRCTNTVVGANDTENQD